MLTRLCPDNSRLLLVSLLIAALAGCGWQLRDAPAFTGLEALAITGGSKSLRLLLENELEDTNVRVHDQAPWRLVIDDEDWQRRTIAVDREGRAAEVALHLRLRWQLLRNDNDEPAAPQQRLAIERTYHYNPDSAVAASDEAELLREELYRDAVWQLMRQLEASVGRLPQTPGESVEPEA